MRADIVAAGMASRHFQVMCINAPRLGQFFIRQVFGDDVQYGIRGSLSTGVKYSTGGPFNPNDFDVDAFIISKDLPAGFSRDVMPNSMEVRELEETIKAELQSLEGFEGMREEFGFRNWKREQPGSTLCT